jgi:hypothetical protein
MGKGAAPGELGRGRHHARRAPGGPTPPHPDIPPPAEPAYPPGGSPAHGPLLGTEAGGLCTFNIGLVPASVTPPRTWRHAAWFAVLSSAAVLVGLMVAATLIGPSRSNGRIDTLPGYPSYLPPILPTPDAPGGRTALRRPVELAAAGSSAAGTRSWRTGHGADDDVSGDVPSGTGASGGARPAPPTVSTVAGAGVPIIDGDVISDQTEHFYGTVVSDIRQAYAMTTGALHADGGAALVQRYRDVSSVRLRQITVDPSRGVTVNLLEITWRNGPVVTERRELVFSPGDVPKISDERRS